jgi:hypothetical protein
METSFQKITVFVASPGDTVEERHSLVEVIEELNRGVAADRRLFLELLRWETHAWPGIGTDAQDVINREINIADVLIVILWKRLGTPTGRSSSGTVEEFERVYSQSRAGGKNQVLIYFKTTPYYPSTDDVEQIGKVLQFRQMVEKLGALTWNFSSTTEFRDSVRKHLTQVVRNWTNIGSVSTPPPNSQVGTDLNSLIGGQTAQPSPVGLRTEQFSKLLAGSLELSIDARDSASVERIMSMVEPALLQLKFGTRALRAAQVIIWELLSNKARHGHSNSEVKLEITVDSGYEKKIQIRFTDDDPAFNLNGEIVSSSKRSDHKLRPHGLWRVKQCTSDFGFMTLGESGYAIRCTVLDRVRPTTPFARLNNCRTFIVEWGWPRTIWFDNVPYLGYSIRGDLERGLNPEMGALLDLYFGRGPREVNYLCIHIKGDTVLSELPPFLHEVLCTGIERYFADFFNKRKVLALNEESSDFWSVCREWQRQYDIPIFDDVEGCQRYLDKIIAERRD